MTMTGIGDAELLSILLGADKRKRPPLSVAADLVQTVGGVAALSRASPHELAQVTGVGAIRAERIAAAFELGRRATACMQRQHTTLSDADDVFRIIHPRLAGIAQELFFVIGIDIRNQLLDVVEVGRGSVHAVEVHPREVFRPLVRMAASGGVLIHNHPSGDPTPSPQDIELTRRFRAVGDVIGIPIIDHVVIGGDRFRSIAEWVGTEL